ncbi:hypothetical protein KA517_03970 [Candidatus Gracilibacteria bacterium]|nr:hypothetical protein [Candidatus Gracilibacteria bacterium]
MAPITDLAQSLTRILAKAQTDNKAKIINLNKAAATKIPQKETNASIAMMAIREIRAVMVNAKFTTTSTLFFEV